MGGRPRHTRSKTRRASSSEDVTPFMGVCDAPNSIAPSEGALTRNPEVPSLRNSTDRSPQTRPTKRKRPTLNGSRPSRGRRQSWLKIQSAGRLRIKSAPRTMAPADFAETTLDWPRPVVLVTPRARQSTRESCPRPGDCSCPETSCGCYRRLRPQAGEAWSHLLRPD